MFHKYPKQYVGKDSFVRFMAVSTVVKDKLTEDKRKMYLVSRKELQAQYIAYCNERHLPRASNVNIGRHLSHCGIKCDTKIGPAGRQERCYSGLVWLGRDLGTTMEKKAVVNRIAKAEKPASEDKIVMEEVSVVREETQQTKATVEVIPQTPPAVQPEAQTPPAVQPEAQTPPAVQPEAQTPPAVQPEAQTPPAVQPEAQTPPAVQPEAQTPPAVQPEAQTPPTQSDAELMAMILDDLDCVRAEEAPLEPFSLDSFLY